MVLTIDVGNTRIKTAVFEQHTLVELFLFTTNDFKIGIQNILNKYPKITNAIVSSVGKLQKEDFSGFSIKVNFIDHETILPIENLYQTPKTLGIDRIVLATGASLLHPDKIRLIIDAGTCITYDYINDKNQYLGGAISPGLKLRYQSLHNYTARLPLLKLENPQSIIGNDTSSAIHSGVVNGVVNEIEGFVEQFEQENSNFIIILTGGDTEFLAKRLKNTIFANPNFLLESLNLIYLHKNQND